MFNSNCASVPLVANIDGNGNGNNGWGDGSWLWFIIVIFAIFGGCGNGFGWGGNNGRDGYPCATQADVRAAVDQQTLMEIATTDGVTMEDGCGLSLLFLQSSDGAVMASEGAAAMVVMAILVLHRQMLEPR